MRKFFFGKKEKLLSEKYEGLRFSLYTVGFIIIIFLVVEVVLLFYWSMLNFYVETEQKNIFSVSSSATSSRLKNNYLSAIKLISNDLAQANLDKTNYQLLKEKLLSLSVPKEYLDWHFRLVVAIDKLLDYMTLQESSPSREHEQLISAQATYISEYLVTIDYVGN